MKAYILFADGRISASEKRLSISHLSSQVHSGHTPASELAFDIPSFRSMIHNLSSTEIHYLKDCSTPLDMVTDLEIDQSGSGETSSLVHRSLAL